MFRMTKRKNDDTFIKVTNKDVYTELKSIRKQGEQNAIENERQHNTIISKMDTICSELTIQINAVEEKSEITNAKMKGNINSVRALAVSALAVAGYAVVWLWQWATK